MTDDSGSPGPGRPRKGAEGTEIRKAWGVGIAPSTRTAWEREARRRKLASVADLVEEVAKSFPSAAEALDGDEEAKALRVALYERIARLEALAGAVAGLLGSNRDHLLQRMALASDYHAAARSVAEDLRRELQPPTDCP